ncbi:DsbA family oxidoreductase [Actinokineospora sp. NBRC 105648]|uniref:DsbA family oxidoreductase n=1 Tax=Actinokineospora sp. NBRC 105648 TaxID=3032206 RepID=UPI0024A0F607|nr:DsbA family oxidoreductase [Actinokineospora sp. NBRC 105648]GLZ39644.1 DSBA oxidoreductase [Actinokineospora sp. NBRC 105648]
MRIEIWSDVACPWCNIGRARLQRALERFEHPVDVRWRSFELDPTSPPDDGLAREMLARRKGLAPEQVAELTAHVTQVAAEDGLVLDFDRVRAGNTNPAHQLLHLAAEHGVQDELKGLLFHAQFTDGLALADERVLFDLVERVGIDRAVAEHALREGTYADAVRADQREAAELGATSVPFFVVDRRFAFAGAQPVELIVEVLEKAWAELTPTG